MAEVSESLNAEAKLVLVKLLQEEPE